MRKCRGCGTALSKRSQKIYCGNACQAAARRDANTKRWLESVEAWIDGRHSHYVRQYIFDAQSGCCAMRRGENVAGPAPRIRVGPHRRGPDEQSTGEPAACLSEL